jgi:hypothetical protein
MMTFQLAYEERKPFVRLLLSRVENAMLVHGIDTINGNLRMMKTVIVA